MQDRREAKTPEQRRELVREILRRGGPLRQHNIQVVSALSVEETDQALRELEQQGAVRKVWWSQNWRLIR
jgi:predicted transcriptional regulator